LKTQGGRKQYLKVGQNPTDFKLAAILTDFKNNTKRALILCKGIIFGH
jgi:hypothetical protein